MSQNDQSFIIWDITWAYHGITVNTTHLVGYLDATLMKEHEYGEEEMKAASENSN